jgi:hypothetical protein
VVLFEPNTGTDADINEAVAVEWVPLADIPARISRREIFGSASVVGLLVLLNERRASA